METPMTKDLDLETSTSPPTKIDQDLLGDLGDVSFPSKTESSIKADTLDQNLLESIAKPTEIETPKMVITVNEPKIDIDFDIKNEIVKEPEPIVEIKSSDELESVKEVEPVISVKDVEPVKSVKEVEPVKVIEPLVEIKPQQVIEEPPSVEPFGFNKPLPPEPFEATADFLKSESNDASKIIDDKDDDFVGAPSDISPAPLSREESPIPPPVPKHQSLRDESPDRFESSPEPDFKPMDSGKEIEDIFEPPPVIAPAPKQEEPKHIPTKETKKQIVGDIGAKDIIVEIDAWFNPARLHPQVESLVYWRDPRKSGVVFGVLMVTLLSLTTLSLISVIAYLGLLTLTGTISFRIYKNIMQAIQKTSDGHPFKEYLEKEISLPEDKVAETSKLATQQINAAISALRSLFLVEDLIDSIKGLVLFWALTYIGAVFNGLTLLILGVVLVFSIPRLYEKNKSQVDAYIHVAMDKLSVITNRMKAAIPVGKKDEKPKDQ